MVLNKKLEKEILDYCLVNNIINVDKFLNDIISRGFTIAKYGNNPKFTNNVLDKNRVIEEINPLPLEVTDPIKKVKEIKEKINKVIETGELTKIPKEYFGKDKKDMYGE
jgi:hypothetical protein